MTAVGIVAEYNPFHSGHLHQIEAVRSAVGQDVPIVAALSGDFVQRGEAAAFSKFARAEAAVRCGVSLVLELPLPWCLSSAETFARGGIGLLSATGLVDTISFGSESGDRDALRRCAEVLDSDAFPPALREAMAGGASFAAAREKAVRELAGADAALLKNPNDVLGVEYIRAIRLLGDTIGILPVRREGSTHDGPGSASALRAVMAESDTWLDNVPAPAAEVFRRELDGGRGPVTAEGLRLPVMSRLRMLPESAYAGLPDAAEGLDHRLYRAVRDTASPEAAAAAAKSRRYALSRLRRMLMCAALGIGRDTAAGLPPYIRVLAMDEKGIALLHKMRRTALLPVITRPARVRRTDERAEEIFTLNAQAHDLYVLGYRDAGDQTAGEDWRRSPFVYAD